jgi:hypothetical protein
VRKNSPTQSGIFNPRVLIAFVLCTFGVLMGMFAFAATPLAQTARSNTGASIDPTNFLSGLGSNANPLLRGALIPRGTQSSLNNRQGDLSSIRPTASSRWFAKQQSGAAPSVPLASAVSGKWSIVDSPNSGFAPTSLSAVTCVSASDCWAVGRTEIGQTFANTTLMHWDGDSWKLVASPSVEKETSGLVDITCVSSSSCWAVGYRIILQTVQVQTLILHWNGTSWQIVPSPNVGTGFNALYGVTCASDSDCWAVGFENGGSLAQTLIEKWDGTSWTVHASPKVGTQHNVLNAVTCSSSSDCLAVGYSGVAGAKNSLVARWNGTAWTASALPNQISVQESVLSSVMCNSTSDCWAVGDSYNGLDYQTLIERWDGTTWTSAIAPNSGADNYLSRVTCASTSDCWAVGHSSNATIDPQSFDQDLVLHWNGSVWLLDGTLPDPTATYATDLAGVACASASECWAVGSIKPSGSGRSHITRWDGTSWTQVAAPDVPALPSNFLYGVTCVSGSNCWAVGFDFYGNVARSLTEHWDGTAWEIKDSPNTALDRNNYLGDITCVSGSDCWAVGSSTDSIGAQDQTLAMHWDGTAWSIVSTAPVDTSQVMETSFEGVACVSSSDCWAVGYSQIQDYQAIIQHWNGAAWTLVPAALQLSDPTTKTILYDVACTSTSDCTAVGVQWSSALTGSGLYQTLVEHWDGSAWSIVPSANTAPDQDNILSGVTCTSSSDCWAVGSSNNYSQSLIERWDGSSWSIVASPQVGSILTAVTCSSASDCWAAGPYYTPNPPAQTLFVHWNGTSWTKVASPNTSAADSNNLSGIACASSSDCWAVGQYWRKGSPQTLTLHYAPSPPVQVTGVVSRKVHGTAGTFDVDLPLNGNPGIECRSGGANGNYTLVFSFANPLTSVDGASPTSGTGSVGSSNIDSNDAHNYIVELTGVANAQVITVRLSNVTDLTGNFSNAVSVEMEVLIGDTTGNGAVNSSDIAQTQSQSGQPVTSSNFREDVTVNGVINSSDIGLVQAKSGTTFP